MSTDPEYQTKDPTYDAVNKKLIIGMALLAAAIIAVWYCASLLFEGPSLL
jgi:hypothetical protein